MLAYHHIYHVCCCRLPLATPIHPFSTSSVCASSSRRRWRGSLHKSPTPHTTSRYVRSTNTPKHTWTGLVCDASFRPFFPRPSRQTRPDDSSLKDLRELWWRPHVGALLRAMAMRNQAYSATVRLVKQWLGHQLVDRADDWCEHVVYRVFQDPSPFMEAPNTPHVGLVRSEYTTEGGRGFDVMAPARPDDMCVCVSMVVVCRCVLFVSGFEWEGAPLTVDLDETLAHNPEQQHQLQLAYERSVSACQ